MFDRCKTVAEVKALYRQLAKLHHPDRGGSTRTMQEVNAAYHARLEALNGQATRGSDGKEHVYRYDFQAEQEVVDKVAELLALGLEGIEIEIIGRWIWVSGDTRPVKDQLKAAGCSWHSKRVMWYWRKFDYRRKYSEMDFDDLRQMYGSQVVPQGGKTRPAGALAAA
jgi:hypothetical protein